MYCIVFRSLLLQDVFLLGENVLAPLVNKYSLVCVCTVCERVGVLGDGGGLFKKENSVLPSVAN